MKFSSKHREVSMGSLFPPLFDLAEREDCYLLAVDLPGFPNPRMEIDTKKDEIQVIELGGEHGDLDAHILFRCR